MNGITFLWDNQKLRYDPGTCGLDRKGPEQAVATATNDADDAAKTRYMGPTKIPTHPMEGQEAS